MANGRMTLNWAPERWQRLNTLVHDEVAKVRVARRVLPLFGPGGAYTNSIVGHNVAPVAPGVPLRIPSGQNLVPVELSVEFQLAPEQFDDEQVSAALATRAAYLLGLAEDYVILSGNRAAPELVAQGVSFRNLDQQQGLYQPDPPQVSGNAILESVLGGISQLRIANHHGEYCVIVAPDLYQAAFRPRQSPLDAPIHQIRPLLKEGGFLYSPAAPPGTGVIFSLGGNTVDIAVPVDAKVEIADEERGSATLRVVEQFRLRINNPTAIVALPPPVQVPAAVAAAEPAAGEAGPGNGPGGRRGR